MNVPAVLLQAMIAVALLWGWPKWAAVTALGFTAMLHPCEFLHCLRKDLVLPSDALGSFEDAFLHIENPKTRRFARHQHARCSDREVVLLLETCFKDLQQSAPLLNYSATIYRSMWNDILTFLEVPHSVKTGGPTPGSLRGSGATDFYIKTEDVPRIAWRGRWKRASTLEF